MMNFQNLVQDLVDLGMSQNEIADSANVTQPLISQILNGKTKTCTYEVGTRLVALHKQRTRKKAA